MPSELRQDHQHSNLGRVWGANRLLSVKAQVSDVRYGLDGSEVLFEFDASSCDPAALADIREADEAYARGDVVRGVEAVRQLGK